jgi:hypothetical protein
MTLAKTNQRISGYLGYNNEAKGSPVASTPRLAQGDAQLHHGELLGDAAATICRRPVPGLTTESPQTTSQHHSVLTHRGISDGRHLAHKHSG